jgi:nucleoside-diphosphate-sugar epimerase
VLSGRTILDQFTVGRVCTILKAGQVGPGTEMYMADGTELWHDIEARADSPDQPCAVRDESGRPWYYQPNDARDIAHCMVCALRSPDAVGESFNGGAPAPFTFPKGARLLEKITGREPLEVTVPVRWMYDHDITKAKSLIGYRPKGDLETMMASAAASEAGEPDYRW